MTGSSILKMSTLSESLRLKPLCRSVFCGLFLINWVVLTALTIVTQAKTLAGVKCGVIIPVVFNFILSSLYYIKQLPLILFQVRNETDWSSC